MIYHNIFFFICGRISSFFFPLSVFESCSIVHLLVFWPCSKTKSCENVLLYLNNLSCKEGMLFYFVNVTRECWRLSVRRGNFIQISSSILRSILFLNFISSCKIIIFEVPLSKTSSSLYFIMSILHTLLQRFLAWKSVFIYIQGVWNILPNPLFVQIL